MCNGKTKKFVQRKKMILNVHFQEQSFLEIFNKLIVKVAKLIFNFMKLVDSIKPTMGKFYEYYD
jgi:hypothetical protein